MTLTGPNNQLLEIYQTYVGDPDRPTDIYFGFGFFFTGIGLGVLGLMIFLWSATLPADSSRMFAIREVAIIASAVGLPTLLASVVVLLPVDRRMLYVTGAGSMICLLAVGLFVWAYPSSWNVATPPDYSAHGVTLYGVGLVGVVGATGAALVAHHLERAMPNEAGSASDNLDPTDGDIDELASASDPDSMVSDEQVQADIDRELSNTELSWGGVDRAETRRLNLNTETLEEMDSTNVDQTSASTARANGSNIDEAVEGLQKFKGEGPDTAVGSDTDEQTAALQQLRKQQRAEEVATKDGVVSKIRDLFTN